MNIIDVFFFLFFFFFFRRTCASISVYVVFVAGVFTCRCGRDTLYLVVSRLSAVTTGVLEALEGIEIDFVARAALGVAALLRNGKRHCLCVTYIAHESYRWRTRRVHR